MGTFRRELLHRMVIFIIGASMVEEEFSLGLGVVNYCTPLKE